MKIFLVGKNGQLGGEINKLAQKEYEVFSFGKDDLDIENHELVRKKIEETRPDIFINTAAYHIVSECEKNPNKAFSINTTAEKNIASLCKEYGVRLVYYSTDKVFDGKKRTPYREDDFTNPIQIYGLSKLAGEIVSLNYNPDSIVIRTCGIFGGVSGSREKKGNFVLYILEQAKKAGELEISSEQKANFVYAEDLALATLDLLKVKAKSGIYNIVNDDYSSWSTFASEIVRIRNLKLKIKPVDRRGSYGDTPTPIFTALNTSKIKSYNIQLSDWKNALRRYLDFLKPHGI